MENIKGGFPPINYDVIETETDKQNSTRERSFVSTINKKNINVGIREILKENNIKPIIDFSEKKEDLNVLDTF
jgi:hypothetical protein